MKRRMSAASVHELRMWITQIFMPIVGVTAWLIHSNPEKWTEFKWKIKSKFSK